MIRNLVKRMLPAIVLTAMLAGCAGHMANNYLRPEDFARYLEREGLKVENVRDLMPDPFRATSGTAFLVAGSEIGLYKYDQTSEVQQKRLAEIAKKKRTYIQGIPYPVEVRGSFMLMGLDKNPEKRTILRAYDKFE